MKSRLIARIIFLIILIILAIGLIYIIFSDRSIYKKRLPKTEDYLLVYNGTCAGGKYLVYEDKDNKYYVPCSTADIQIKWDSGYKEYVTEALENSKVTITSLREHGLEIDETSK